MSQLLEGKVVVVTGASRKGGIGRGICERFLELGAKVVVSDVGHALPLNPDYPIPTTEALDETVAELTASGGEAIGVRCDITKAEEIDALVKAAVDRFGEIDVWVNNAGIAVNGTAMVDIAQRDLDMTVDVNVKGTFQAMQVAARYFIGRGKGGRIINTASQAGKTGWPLLSAYSASKFAVVGMTQSAAAELGQHGITVNSVCPGTVATELSNHSWEILANDTGKSVEELQAATMATIPLGRFQTPRDVADLVVWIAGDDAGYITGQSINTTGGQEMH